MIFTRRFFLLFALGALPLVLAWSWPWARWALIGYDAALLAAAYLDYLQAREEAKIEVARRLTRRFMIGAENEVQIAVSNRAPRKVTFTIKDEYPPELELRGERLLRVRPRRDEAVASYRLFAAARPEDLHRRIETRQGSRLA